MPRELGQPHIEGATVVFIVVLVAALLMLFYDDHMIPSFTNAATTPSASQRLPLLPPALPL